MIILFLTISRFLFLYGIIILLYCFSKLVMDVEDMTHTLNLKVDNAHERRKQQVCYAYIFTYL